MRQSRLKRMCIFIFMATLLMSCENSREPAQLKFPSVSAQTMTAEEKTILLTRNFPGQVEAKDEITLSSKIAGYVTSAPVEEGSYVRKGTLLLTIDDRELKRRIKSLKANLEKTKSEKHSIAARLAYARTNYNRFQRLFKDQAATAEEYDRSKAEYNALSAREKALSAGEKAIHAQIGEMRARLSYYRIKAPTDGLVARKFVDTGSFVTAGKPFLVLDDLNKGFWFVAEVDESLLKDTKIEPRAAISIPSLNAFIIIPRPLLVHHIDPRSHTFRIKVDLSRKRDLHNLIPQIRAGMYGRFFYFLGKSKRILLPWNLIVYRGSLKSVYVVGSNKKIHFRLVKTGATFKVLKMGEKKLFVPFETIPGIVPKKENPEYWVEILSGLNSGEVVVTSNLYKISEGTILK